MSSSLFERTEQKYFLQKTQYEQLIDAVGTLLEDDAYPHSLVSSLFYDNAQDDMINRSIAKPLYKEKLRLRAYRSIADDGSLDGEVDESHLVFVELKKKFKGITYKRRTALANADAAAYMEGLPYAEAARRSRDRGIDLPEEPTWETRQIVRELDATIARHQPLRPLIFVSVDRLAKRTNDGSDIRITFDTNACWRTHDLAFQAGAGGFPLFDDDHVVMEVKCLHAYPLWMVHAFNDLHIYPQALSKVGLAYQQACRLGALPTKQEGFHCA